MLPSSFYLLHAFKTCPVEQNGGREKGKGREEKRKIINRGGRKKWGGGRVSE